jgi:hypothetical protein
VSLYAISALCEPAGDVLRDARHAVREAVHLREGVELATVVDQVPSVPLPDRRPFRVVAPVLVTAFRKRRTELLEGRVAVPDARAFAERCVERRRVAVVDESSRPHVVSTICCRRADKGHEDGRCHACQDQQSRCLHEYSSKKEDESERPRPDYGEVLVAWTMTNLGT